MKTSLAIAMRILACYEELIYLKSRSKNLKFLDSRHRRKKLSKKWLLRKWNNKNQQPLTLLSIVRMLAKIIVVPTMVISYQTSLRGSNRLIYLNMQLKRGSRSRIKVWRQKSTTWKGLLAEGCKRVLINFRSICTNSLLISRKVKKWKLKR